MELGRSGRSMMMMDAAPAAPHLDLLGPPGWCSGCWPTMELGRSERPTLRPLWSYRADGADSPDRTPR